MRWRCWALCGLGLLAGVSAFASEPVASTNQSVSTVQPVLQAPVQAGERLSQWLLRHAEPQADSLALQWRVAAERVNHYALQQALLQTLQGPADLALPQPQRLALADWVQALPVTGRLPLAQHDVRWLQANPEQDPVLAEGHAVLLPPRPRWVAVMSELARPCLVPHQPGALAMAYWQACHAGTDAVQATERPDTAWLVQPDGRVSVHGVAPWNLAPQDEPAPGAWLWMPSRQAALPATFSDHLARFLATQLPAEFLPDVWVSAQAVQQSLGQSAEAALPRGAVHTANDWGEAGYWQTPSARMGQAGSVRFHVSRVWPYTRISTLLQPLDWFEFGFRYTSVSNRLYGPSIAGDQAYKDKSIDFRVRLLPEDAHWPEVTVGVRDVGGTGLFASEYLVASKRWGDWDASLGLAWGNLGSRGNVRNPLTLFSDRFATRPGRAGGDFGGELGLGAWFKGPAALIGGVQWAPSERWVLKAELDGNNYQNEPQSNNQPVDSPVNLGLVYRYSPHIDLSLAVERGNRLAMGLTLHGQLNRLHSPKLLDPVLPPLGLAPTAQPEEAWHNLPETLNRYTGWHVTAVQTEVNTLRLQADVDAALYLQERIDRAVAVLHRLAPAHLGRFELALQRRGLPILTVAVDRAEWVAQRLVVQAPALRLNPQEAYAVAPASTMEVAPDRLRWQVGPSYSQILGGPDAFLIYQLGLQAQLEYHLGPSTWVEGTANLRLIDNYDRFKYDSTPSALPRVRRDLRLYAVSSRLTLPSLQLNHVRNLGQGHYWSAYAGWLEPMFAGVGSEWLYRPWRGRWAVGVDVNHARQRGYRQDFSLRDYSAFTGHATLYWDTHWHDVNVKLQAGRYLAGDVGATLEVSRTFRNGVSVGAWATKTNVSAAEFGEGSFDKGIFVNIPFDAMLPLSTGQVARIRWVPVTGDGGARLNRRLNLFDLTQARGPRGLQWAPAAPPERRSGDHTSQVLTAKESHPLRHPVGTGLRLADQVAGIPGSTWLWAGGAVLASALLDQRADRWAQNHQTGTWDQVGRVANVTPFVLAAGAGALALGLGDDAAATTGETALRAAVYAVGTSLAIKTVLGRARPNEGQGAAQFSGPSRTSYDASFPSIHTTAAFALVTPFAQQYRMPWLYAVAAAAGFGRVQQREHWVSDTVAGAFIGYGIGSLLSEQQQGGPRWQVTPEAVTAHWSF